MTSLADDLRARTIGSLLWKFLERGGYHGVQLLVQIVLARLLLPADFGMVAILLVFINVGNVLVQSGLNTALVQSPSIDDDDPSTVFWFSLFIAAALYAAAFLGAPAIARWYSLPGLTAALRVLGLVLFVGAYNSVQIALASRALDFRPVFRSTMEAAVLSGSAGIAMAYLGTGYWALITQQLVFQAIACIAMARAVDWRPRLVFNLAHARDFYRYGSRLCTASLLDTAYLGVYDLAIGKAFSRATLGLFSQGKKFPATLNSLFDGSIQTVMLSTMSKLQDSANSAKRALRRAVSVSSFLIIPVMAVLFLTAPSLVQVLLTEKWLGAVPYLRAFCVLYAVQPVQTNNLQAISAMGRSDIVLRVNLVKRMIGLAIIAFTVVVLRNPYAVAAGAVLDGYIAATINAGVSTRLLRYGLREQLLDVLPAFGLSLLAMGMAYMVTLPLTDGLVKLLAQTVVVLGSYALLSSLLKVESHLYVKRTLIESWSRRVSAS